MDIVDYYNKNIIEEFDKYYIPDLNIEDSKIVFLLESGHDKEILYRIPLAGTSGKRFSFYLLDKKKPFGLLKNKPITIGILESSPYPLQTDSYRKVIDNNYPINSENVHLVAEFQELRNTVDDLEEGELLNTDIINTNLFKDYCERMEAIIDTNKHIVVCGKFAQHFFETFMSLTDRKMGSIGKGEYQYGEQKIIYINHPKNWTEGYCHFNRYVKPTLLKIRELIEGLS